MCDLAGVGQGVARGGPDRVSCVACRTCIARSRWLYFVRTQQRWTRITTAAGQDDPDFGPAMSNWRPNPSDAVEQSERKQKVEAALGALSEPQRQAIELAYFEGLSQSEIAERLQEPLGTVKTRVRLGMQKLRDALRPYYAGVGR